MYYTNYLLHRLIIINSLEGFQKIFPVLPLNRVNISLHVKQNGLIGCITHSYGMTLISQKAESKLQAVEKEVLSEIQWILDEAQNGNLELKEAEQCLQELVNRAPKQETAKESGGWAPQVNQEVKIVKMGNKIGKVVASVVGMYHFSNKCSSVHFKLLFYLCFDTWVRSNLSFAENRVLLNPHMCEL